jgi:Flp pilus assembly protein TadD
VTLSGVTQPSAQSATPIEEYFKHAQALAQQGKLADAEILLENLLRKHPNDSFLLHRIGVIAMQAKRFDRAVELFQRAITLKPDFAEAYNDCGIALRKLNRPEEALANYARAIALKPEFAMAYNNRTNALLDLRRPAEALDSCDKAIALNPEIVIAHYNRGNALQELYRHEEALASYDKAIALAPDFIEAKWNKGLCLLLLGRFDEGLPLYELRKWRHNDAVATRTFPQPLWIGTEDIVGKTLFIWWEQGFGDTLQFFRYAKLAETRGAKLILSVQDSLRKLLRQISPTIEFIDQDDIPKNFDCHCPLLSLPLAFGTRLETIPQQQPYLQPDENLRRVWAVRLPPRSRTRVGLVWSGRTEHKNDLNRSIALDQLLPLLNLDVDWICLQNEPRADDLALLRQVGRIRYFKEELKDFSDTAALLDLTDLVITVDTSVAHLAGAMGKPVWILLPYNPDWRWSLDREDSPWYPSARLFRQDDTRAWNNVITRVSAALGEVIQRSS